MKLADRERFARGAVRAFVAGLGVTLALCVAADGAGGAWEVHAGRLFPWRHLPGVPLYGSAGLALEWVIGIAAAGLFVVAARPHAWAHAALRGGLGLGLLATVMGLSQRYSNHRALLFIVLVFVALDPPDLAGSPADFAEAPRPTLALVRAQLLLVYATSATGKLLHGFASGAALASLFGWPLPVARPLAATVIAAELLVPALLCVAPRLGVLAAAALHGTMAVLLPSVWPFTSLMTALALLFLPPPSLARS
jgi:hypothetical protein